MARSGGGWLRIKPSFRLQKRGARKVLHKVYPDGATAAITQYPDSAQMSIEWPRGGSQFYDGWPSESKNKRFMDSAWKRLKGKAKGRAAMRKKSRRRNNPRYPEIYASTYCNFAHDVKTGKPIEHECRIIPPAALRAEIDGDYEKAQEILSSTPARYMRKGMRRSNPWISKAAVMRMMVPGTTWNVNFLIPGMRPSSSTREVLSQHSYGLRMRMPNGSVSRLDIGKGDKWEIAGSALILHGRDGETIRYEKISRMNPRPEARFNKDWRRRPSRMHVFDSGVEGAPNLNTMNEIARLVGGTVEHIGFGSFLIRKYDRGQKRDIAYFEAGGSMERDPSGYSYAPFRIERGATASEKKRIRAYIRDRFPEATRTRRGPEQRGNPLDGWNKIGKHGEWMQWADGRVATVTKGYDLGMIPRHKQWLWSVEDANRNIINEGYASSKKQARMMALDVAYRSMRRR